MFSEITAQVYKAACLILLTACVMLAAATWHYSTKASKLQSDIDTAKGEYEEAKKSVERDYNRSVVEVERIKRVYVPKIEYVDRYIGDKNASDCKNGIDLFRSVEY